MNRRHNPTRFLHKINFFFFQIRIETRFTQHSEIYWGLTKIFYGNNVPRISVYSKKHHGVFKIKVSSWL